MSNRRRMLVIATLCLAFGAGAALAQARQVAVGQKGRSFSAKELSLKKGQTVVFLNDDDTAHNVFSPDFNLGIQKPGDAKEIRFDRTGRFEVGCELHPRMKLQVTVAE